MRVFRFLFALSPIVAALVAAPVLAADGLYAVATGANSVMIVDSTTITPDRTEHATAIFYELRRDGNNARVTADFDCQGHRWRALAVHLFGVTKDGNDIWEDDIDPPPDYVDVEDGTVLRATETFVCRWPGSVIGKAGIPDAPDDPAAQMLMLARSAKATFDGKKP